MSLKVTKKETPKRQPGGEATHGQYTVGRTAKPEPDRSVSTTREGPFVLLDARGSPYLVPRALRIIRGGDEPVYLALEPHAPWVFGRSSEANVLVEGDSISRHHGKLSFRNDGRWVYRDLGSSNGSYLSEFLDAEPTEDLRRLDVGRDHVVSAGQTIILARGAARISLLPALPSANPSPQNAMTSAASRRLERAVADHAFHDLPLLLLGPTGSGKTFLARRIHEMSGRAGQFVVVNCARLPRDVAQLHSQLLGHEKGAYTGSEGARLGELQAADRGTLFLDEVESMEREGQQFLLDLLEPTGVFAPLGARPGTPPPRPDFRLISASKMPLTESALRQDLSYRLAKGGVIQIPSLEERRQDIPALIATFLDQLRTEKRVDAELSGAAISLLTSAPWRGHVRELQGFVETVVQVEAGRQRAQALRKRPTELRQLPDRSAAPPLVRVVISKETVTTHLEARSHGMGAVHAAKPERRIDLEGHPTVPFDVQSLPAELRAVPSTPSRKRSEDLTEQDVQQALERNDGNKTHAAKALGIAVNTLKAKMKTFGL